VRPVRFVKTHGIGNDFVVLDTLSNPLPSDFAFPAFAIEACDRHRGVGGDGLLLLCEPDEEAAQRGAVIRMRMWNPDGTEDMCGNGLRCVAYLANQRGHAAKEFLVQTLAGDRLASISDNGHVRVNMGRPLFEADAIPMTPPPGLSPLRYSLEVGGRCYPWVTSLSTGSTHTVIFVEELPGDGEFRDISPLIEHHPYFPERTTVLWAHVAAAQLLELRIWERGVGETLACGTGGCAAAVAAHVNGRSDAAQGIIVHSKGGELQITWQPDSEIYKSGPATIVYTADYALTQD
jgi:diaminopimelate epimerase